MALATTQYFRLQTSSLNSLKVLIIDRTSGVIFRLWQDSRFATLLCWWFPFPLFGHNHGHDKLSGASEETNECMLVFIRNGQSELSRFTGCFESYLGVCAWVCPTLYGHLILYGRYMQFICFIFRIFIYLLVTSCLFPGQTMLSIFRTTLSDCYLDHFPCTVCGMPDLRLLKKVCMM